MRIGPAELLVSGIHSLVHNSFLFLVLNFKTSLLYPSLPSDIPLAWGRHALLQVCNRSPLIFLPLVS